MSVDLTQLKTLIAYTDHLCSCMPPNECAAGRKIAEREDETAAMVILQVPDNLERKQNTEDVRGACCEVQTRSREG